MNKPPYPRHVGKVNGRNVYEFIARITYKNPVHTAVEKVLARSFEDVNVNLYRYYPEIENVHCL